MAENVWRKSSFSDNGDCVELAQVDDRVLVRNSQHPARATIAVTSTAMGAFVAACSAGDLDDLG